MGVFGNIFGGKPWNKPTLADQSPQPSSQANIPDYSTYSKDDLLNCCLSKDWEKMGDPQREKLLQAVSANYAKEHGVSVPPVHLDSTMAADKLGGYGRGRITLNPIGLSNPYEALDTIIHETNHHVQAQNVASHSGNTEDNLALFACERTRIGYGDGGGGTDDKRYYALQALEADSNNAAFAYLAENHDRFKSDPKYLEYLKGREQHFETMKDNYENDPSKWKQMEIAHIKASGWNGVDSDTRNRAIQTIQNGPDETKRKAFENAENARNLREQCEMHQLPKTDEEGRINLAAQQSHQRSQRLIDNPRTTTQQLERQYLTNQDKLSEVNGKLGDIDSRKADKWAEMEQMHRENDGRLPEGWQDRNDETGQKYTALKNEYNDLVDKKKALTNSWNILEADNENLNAMYKERLPNEPSLDEKYKDRTEEQGKGSAVNQGVQNDAKQADGMQQDNGQQEIPGAANGDRKQNSILATPEETPGATNGQNVSNDGHDPIAKTSNETNQDENEKINGIQNTTMEKRGTTNDQNISNDGHDPGAKTSNETKLNENEKVNGIREQNPSVETPGTTSDQNISNGIHEPVSQTPNHAKTDEVSNGIQDTPKSTATQSTTEKDNGISGSDTGISSGAEKSVSLSE